MKAILQYKRLGKPQGSWLAGVRFTIGSNYSAADRDNYNPDWEATMGASPLIVGKISSSRLINDDVIAGEQSSPDMKVKFRAISRSGVGSTNILWSGFYLGLSARAGGAMTREWYFTHPSDIETFISYLERFYSELAVQSQRWWDKSMAVEGDEETSRFAWDVYSGSATEAFRSKVGQRPFHPSGLPWPSLANDAPMLNKVAAIPIIDGAIPVPVEPPPTRRIRMIAGPDIYVPEHIPIRSLTAAQRAAAASGLLAVFLNGQEKMQNDLEELYCDPYFSIGMSREERIEFVQGELELRTLFKMPAPAIVPDTPEPEEEDEDGAGFFSAYDEVGNVFDDDDPFI